MLRRSIDDEAAEGLSTLMMLGMMFFFYWMMLAVQCRRWHDLNMSGWWFLMSLVPLVGPLYVLINVGFTKGTYGRNRFGADPLEPRRDPYDFDDPDHEPKRDEHDW